MNRFHLFLYIGVLFWISIGFISCNSSKNDTHDSETLEKIPGRIDLELVLEQSNNFNESINPVGFIEFYDSVNILLQTVPDTFQIKSKIRNSLKQQMRNAGIFSEAIKQSKLIINEANGNNYTDSIAILIRGNSYISQVFADLNELDSLTIYQLKALQVSRLHKEVQWQASMLNNRGMFFFKRQ